MVLMEILKLHEKQNIGLSTGNCQRLGTAKFWVANGKFGKHIWFVRVAHLQRDHGNRVSVDFLIATVLGFNFFWEGSNVFAIPVSKWWCHGVDGDSIAS